MANFMRSLNTFAGGASRGFLDSSQNMRRNQLADISIERSKAQIAAWKQLGDYFKQYQDKMKLGSLPAPQRNEMLKGGMTVDQSSDQGQPPADARALAPAATDQSEPATSMVPPTSMRRLTPSLPFIYDGFGSEGEG